MTNDNTEGNFQISKKKKTHIYLKMHILLQQLLVQTFVFDRVIPVSNALCF